MAAANAVLDRGGIERLMDRVRDDEQSAIRGLLAMLLANLTQSERGAALLLQEGRAGLEGSHLRSVLSRALSPCALPRRPRGLVSQVCALPRPLTSCALTRAACVPARRARALSARARVLHVLCV